MGPPAAAAVEPAVITVVTAVLPARSEHLASTWTSLLGQQLPPGWSWQWCLQADGPGQLDLDVSDARISPGRTDAARGPAIARTLTLGRAIGSLTRVLDADDQLTEGALARDIAAFERDPALHWVTSAALDLQPDGSTRTAPADPPSGRLAAGWVIDQWAGNGFRSPVHPATLCIRTRSLLGLGGWMALPASEDTALLLALDALWPGYFEAEPGLLYRKWPRQLTAQPAHVDADQRRARSAVIQQRIDALRELRADLAGPRGR
jgi:hypothetical protein